MEISKTEKESPQLRKYKVFISSTILDEKKVIRELIKKKYANSKNIELIMSEFADCFPKNPDPNMDTFQCSLDPICDCDIYVLILNENYGNLMPRKKISITHGEFQEAQRFNKPRIAFIEASVLNNYEIYNYYVSENDRHSLNQFIKYLKGKGYDKPKKLMKFISKIVKLRGAKGFDNWRWPYDKNQSEKLIVNLDYQLKNYIKKLDNKDHEIDLLFREFSKKSSLSESLDSHVLKIVSHQGFLENIQAGIDLMANGKYKEAIFFFNRFLENNPSDKNAIFERIKCQFFMGEKENALIDINDYIDKFGKSEVNCVLKGALLSSMKSFEKLLEVSDEILELNQDNLWGNFYKGLALFELGQKVKSREYIIKSIGITKTSDFVFDLFCDTLDREQQITALEQILCEFSEYSIIHKKLGLLLILKDTKKALKHLETYLRIQKSKGIEDHSIKMFIERIKNTYTLVKSIERLKLSFERGLGTAKTLLSLRRLIQKIRKDIYNLKEKYELKPLLDLVNTSSYVENMCIFFDFFYELLLFRSKTKIPVDRYYSSPFENRSGLFNNLFFIPNLKYVVEICNQFEFEKDLKDLDSKTEQDLLYLFKLFKKTRKKFLEDLYKDRKYKYDRLKPLSQMTIREKFLFDLKMMEGKLDNIDSQLIKRDQIVKIWKGYGYSIIDQAIKNASFNEKVSFFKETFPNETKINRFIQINRYDHINVELDDFLSRYFSELFKNLPNPTKWDIKPSDFLKQESKFRRFLKRIRLISCSEEKNYT